MEMSTAEFASVNGVACDVLDAQGRLVITPNALTLDGQSNIPADLRLGESLAAFLARHVPGIASGAWAVSIGGRAVPQAMWARTYPKHGQLIACRCTVRKTVLPLIATLALTYFTMGAGAGWIASSFGVTAGGTAAAMIGAGLFVAGSLIINKVLGPKVPKPGDSTAREVYSLSSQRNSVRAYEPLPVLWGEMRVTPDLASLPYTWYEGDDQYLSTILLGGVNVHSAADLSVGDTPITSYEGVELYHNGFSGMASQDVPLYSNADTITGGDLENNGAWVTRTSSAGAVALQVDIEGQLYDVDNKGGILVNTVPIYIETRPAGSTGAWAPAITETLSHSETAVLRRTFTLGVAMGQHEVRVRLGQPRWDEGDGKDACKLAWTVLKSIQADTTDYSAWGRIGIRIKATGQLSGALDTLRATYRARPIPVWNGAAWVTAATRADGLSNPGAIILQTLRGVYAGGVLQFGFGLQDAQIDIEGLKAFMLHCAARGYTYDKWITGQVSLGAFCEEVALAGMGQFTWTDGGRPTVSFVGSGQPISGVVNMANMLKGSFSVAYNLSNAADGIEYQYLDRNRNWETQTLRVAAPGVVTMLNPARITGEGVTTEAHAAVLARYHLAQSLYQYKTIDFGADIEHLDYRRLSVLSLSHDMTQWGFGGRVLGAALVGGQIQLTLDERVPGLPTRYMGLRVPGARDYRVFPVQPFAGESDVLTLVGSWPAELDFPGVGIDNPAHDTLWCYDFKATPGYRVRVVAIEPEADLKGARVSCVPEGPEFWDYVLNGTYTPAPNQSSLPQLGRPSVSNLRVSEQVNVQGDTEWYELHAVWDATGDYDHAQVWAARDGSEALRLVDGNARGSRSTFRIGGAGEWLVEVRPFNAAGLVGQSAMVLYITTMTQRPPRNVDDFVVQEVAGGLRRFAWQYTGDRPPAFAGVQIRYLPGDVPLSTAGWDAMAPLGDADDVYRAQFETTRPEAGQWTFGVRAIDTAGRLSPGVLRFATSLGDNFDQVQQPDLTPPPAPTGVTAAALMTTAQVDWDVPAYTEGHGHGHSIISVAKIVQGQPAPTFADAKSVATAQASPASIPVELGGAAYRLWVQHVSRDGVASLPSEPVDFVTGEDVGGLLDVLAGQIGDAQLSANLAETLEWDRQQALITRLGAIVMDVQERLHSTAAIETVQTVLQAADEALAQQITTVFAAVGGNAAALEDEVLVRASADEALAQQITTVFAAVGENAAALEDEVLVRASAVEAEALARQELAVTVSGNQTAALAAAQAASDAAGAKGKVLYQSAAPAVADRLSQNLWIDTAGGANTPKRWNGSAWVAVTDKVATDAAAAAAAAAQSASEAKAQITAEQQARATAISAEAAARQQLAVAVGENQAAVAQQFSAQAGINGHLSAKYSLAVQVGSGGQSVVGGMQITGTSSAEAGPKIGIAFATDAFSIVSPDGARKTTPFYVQTSPTTVNGVSIPAGVYMDSAVIGNVTALWGRFGTLVADSIQATAISASQLTAGNGVIGGTLKSSNYVANSSGWILRPDGVAEFSGVTVRGTVYASSGAIGGVNISGGGLNAGGYTGYAWPAASGPNGFHLGPGGLLLGNPHDGKYFHVTAAGNVYAPGFSIADGAATFSGALSAANGTFSGSLTAQAINAVNTINIAGDAVTVPAGATAAMGQAAAVVVRMTSPGRVMVIGNASWLAENNSASSAWVRVVCAGQAGAQTSVSLSPGYSGSATAMGMFDVGVGDHYCYVEVGNTGQRAPGPQGITVIGVKR